MQEELGQGMILYISIHVISVDSSATLSDTNN